MPVHLDATRTARVLAAARALSRARGGAWSMAELARESGVARATLYRRFKRREDVLAALERPAASVVPDDTRAALRARALDAFAAVARRKGIASTTLEDVAAEAGLGVATIYRHFGGRDGLLDAFADERTPRAALKALDPDCAPGDALPALARASIEHLVAHGPLLMLGAPHDPETRRVLGRLRRLEARSRAALRARFERWIAGGHLRGDATTLTHGFLGMVAGCVLLGPSGSIAPEPLAESLVRLFLRGCGAPAARGAGKRGAR